MFFFVETVGGERELKMIKNSITLLSNNGDVTLQPPVDNITRLGISRSKFKANHAFEFEAYEGRVKNVNVVVDDMTLIGEAIPHS